MKLASALYGSFYPFDELTTSEGKPLFEDFYTVVKPDELKEDTCLVVWGGGDISPSLYTRMPSQYTGASQNLSRRDADEWLLMQRAKAMGNPIIGVCRGGQMLCALAGGFLVQDVTNHGRSHGMETFDGQIFSTSSLHHQMMYPWGVEHKMLGWSTQKLSKHYIDTDKAGNDVPIEVEKEPEAVWFPTVKGFALQGHPEFVAHDCAYNKWCANMVEQFVFEEK